MRHEAHWEKVYGAKSPQEMSWYEPHLGTSLKWIVESASDHSSSIIDIGGGASTLVDDLLTRGYRSLSVLDISTTAIARSKERLGALASEVRWLVEDVTQCHLPMSAFDIWHDRAVFHFLTQQEERDAYVNCVRKSLKPSGQIIIATFSLDGPRSCSGLPVSQYDVAFLEEQFGIDFHVSKSMTVEHRTPSGGSQEFLYCCFERR